LQSLFAEVLVRSGRIRRSDVDAATGSEGVMHTRSSWRRPSVAWLSVLLGIAILFVAGEMDAGELTLKSGLRLQPGKVEKWSTISPNSPSQSGEITQFPFWMLDDGMRRYFVGNRQVSVPESNLDVELSQFERFEIRAKKKGGIEVIDSVGPYQSASPFNEFGHREVTLIGPKGTPKTYHQGITQLRPQSCTVTGLDHTWEFSIATTSLRSEELAPLLRRCIDLEKPEDRFKVVRFYLQAGLYELAIQELETIARELPDQKAKCEADAIEARQLYAKRWLGELKHRRRAGQHQLFAKGIAAFPTQNIGADILRDVRQLQTEVAETEEKIQLVKRLLGDLQEGLTEEQLKQVAPLRDEVVEQLDEEMLPRLEAFLKLEKDEGLSKAEKLSLAYSGWVVGDANATTDLSNAIRWWQARFHVLQYLRATHPSLRGPALAELMATEGVGTKTVEQLIQRLPPVIDTPGLQAGRITTLTVHDPGRSREDDDGPTALRYSVLLPPEFNPHHTYPVIIALHEWGWTPERILKWWGGDDASPLQSQRHGYIVIAPEYLPAKFGDPLPAPTETIVWESLRDVRRRFLIDSDRVFLSGYGRGADAAFDVALARPDLFAGVIPISGGFITPKGAATRDCLPLQENARQNSWYVVMGEFDFDLYGRHAHWFENQMLNGTDLLVSQYKARGHETFYSEIHRLFEWMELHRRPAEPKEFDFRSLHTTDVRLHWVRWADTTPQNENVPPQNRHRSSRSLPPSFCRLAFCPVRPRRRASSSVAKVQ
jgi:pimeloyl-ACP methyl ester carboxylesterase